MEIPVCNKEKDHCVNCSSHFAALRPSVREVIITKHFEKDLKNKEERDDIIDKIIDCGTENFHEMHKFEFSIKGNHIFRAKKGNMHVLYCILGHKLIFLRVIKNYKEYRKFLSSEVGKLF